MDPDFNDEILTFDELLEDDYYKSEFEARVQQRLEEYSHSDLKGGNDMNDNETVQTEEPVQTETAENAEQPVGASTADDSSATNDAAKDDTEQPKESAKEMTAEQFDCYNETLRRVSKTAKAGLTTRYNAFEDAEVKAAVKKAVMAGETPDVKELAAGVVSRLSPEAETKAEPQKNLQPKAEQRTESEEVFSLKAQIELLKAGIKPDRVDAAIKLFVAEGYTLDKANEFCAKYPEWHQQESAIDIRRGAPLGGATAPTPDRPPVLNDFERKVKEARKARGLE